MLCPYCHDLMERDYNINIEGTKNSGYRCKRCGYFSIQNDINLIYEEGDKQWKQKKK